MAAEIQVDRRADHDRPVAPTTTAQQDITTAGQRRINLIWEVTQAIIAIVVTVANMAVATYQAIHTTPSGVVVQHPTILSISFGTIIGFYFARTNHAAIGGTGNKPSQPYEGR